jgi:ribose 5-phosphate isomerase B
MKIAIGADHGGFRLKAELVEFIRKLGHEVTDYGTYTADAIDYPDLAAKVCQQIQSKEADRGILICGTGIGMSIAANKCEGILCALVHDVFSAKATREHNDTNVLAMGERVIGPGLAQEIVATWLATEFSQSERHCNRIAKVRQLEKKHSANL